LDLYNRCVDSSNYIDFRWFEFYIKIWNIKEVCYFADAMHIIKQTVLGFDNEIDEIKKKGRDLAKRIEDINKGSSKFNG
jgi:hypothetical protein